MKKSIILSLVRRRVANADMAELADAHGSAPAPLVCNCFYLYFQFILPNIKDIRITGHSDNRSIKKKRELAAFGPAGRIS